MQFMRRFLNRFVATALAVACLAALASGAAAEGVSVQGNKRIDSETIASYFTGSDQAAVNKGVKDLYATGLFSDVRVLREGGRVVIRVTENNIINRVAFEGNSKVKTEMLQAEIQSKSRGPYSRATVDADIERIKDIYRRSGRSAASVTARTVDLPNGRLDVVFTVDEGEKTGIKAINFVGNVVYSSGKLRDLMQTTEMNFLSFIKTSDVYDPDKIASDLELIRRFYLKNGYADFRVVGSDAQYDPAQGGYIITITVEEGVQYSIASVVVESHIADIDGASLLPLLRLSAGQIYNGDMVEKSVDALTKEVARRGYAFSQVHPRGDRDPATRTVTIAFVIDEGPRVYVERIVVRGNTRTRDYVIRREFDLGEGDAYNRVIVERAERRLNNLGYFKRVKITNEPGSAPDRVIIVVDVEDQATGALSLSGGYSTSDGFVAEVSVTETNFMGRGQYVKLAVSEGQHSRGVDFSFTEPYFLGNRMAAGFDVYAKKSDVSQYSYYSSFVTGGTLRLGLPITEELTFSPRYSIYNTDITIPNDYKHPYNDCQYPIWGTTPGYNGTSVNYWNSCLTNGEASLALKQAQGNVLTSMVGYTLSYNTLDNNKSPSGGMYAELRQDVAGAGGQSHFVRSTGDLRYYHEIADQIVGLVHLQAGDIQSLGSSQLRIVDNFNMGPSLVRGFAPNGIGPRDVSDAATYGNTSGNALGGTKYVGASLEVQFPIFGLPRDLGLKGAIFADAGTLFGYSGKWNFSSDGVCTPNNVAPNYTQGTCIAVGSNSPYIRTSVGGSIIWASPMGPIRFDFAKALTKSQYDQTQFFRFTGGTTF
ncbi:outer membrane protein assembly factor BamA [Methylocapsa acidiphila]|uniref:outer membrane protein assembly factor BamA n=1 Tax=Methylocapsa acidiphila TaxID=133552 RepID=UPI00041D4690|nr:outer membrane protein assembly factor BamA [Methylocapsa acidiphila]